MTSGATRERPHVFRPATEPWLAPLLLLHGTGDDEHGLVGLGEALSHGAALLLSGQRGADAELLVHAGGHQLVDEHLPAMSDFCAGAPATRVDPPPAGDDSDV